MPSAFAAETGEPSDYPALWGSAGTVRFFPAASSVKYAQLFLLEQIKRRAKEGKSCGRRFLLQQIRDAGYIVGEKEVRDLLQDMAAKRFIDVKKGRNGARITENGLKWFNVNK
nr:winged-helix domain-containing protein [Treponema socranskii]